MYCNELASCLYDACSRMRHLRVPRQVVGIVAQLAQSHQPEELHSLLPSLLHQIAPLYTTDYAFAMCVPSTD